MTSLTLEKALMIIENNLKTWHEMVPERDFWQDFITCTCGHVMKSVQICDSNQLHVGEMCANCCLVDGCNICENIDQTFTFNEGGEAYCPECASELF